jgi:hypothetical protein
MRCTSAAYQGLGGVGDTSLCLSGSIKTDLLFFVQICLLPPSSFSSSGGAVNDLGDSTVVAAPSAATSPVAADSPSTNGGKKKKDKDKQIVEKMSNSLNCK